MYEDRTQNYDPKIHEKYLIHDTPFLLPHRLQPCADYSIAMKTTRLKCNIFFAVTVSLKSGFLKFFYTDNLDSLGFLDFFL